MHAAPSFRAYREHAGFSLSADLNRGFMIRAEGWRSVHGIVRDRSGQPLGGSVVEIEDQVTLIVRSYIVQKDGKYHFMRLSPDIDYTLRARYRNVWSEKDAQRTRLSKRCFRRADRGRQEGRIDFAA